MKKLFIITLLFLLSNSLFIYSQEVSNQKYNPANPNYFIPKNHDANFKSIPTKSFYESKSDWQYIIDTTWGPGVPLSQKLLIFNTYAQKVHNEFDGFISLQLNWDSLYNFYLTKITDSTSKGAFSSIMSHFAYDLKDAHTRAFDNTVVLSPLNPGTPILLISSYITVEHFGAVTTVLPDSTSLVLRVVENHPLNLEPGDIILGYEGVLWKILVKELFDAGLPMIAITGGCKSADTYLNLSGVGLNWHLFSTIDILKHSTGDTVHLSVIPLLNLNIPPMMNNEQLPIPNIPFPKVLPYPFTPDTVVTYGILNDNIGYIYLSSEWPENNADAQFYNAINALKNSDALIIDMRLNIGGWALFDNAFNILFNEFHKTTEDAYRCNQNTFELCPSGDWDLFQINGEGSDFYNRPIAVLLGPTCLSMGDLTAQRLRYHPMVKFFGASSDATLGDNKPINFNGWYINYSVSDMFHANNPDVYLNRREFPIDFPVWHNRDDVAMGKDAVVEKALDWINNVVYPHSTFSDKTFYTTGEDTVNLSTIIENPNSHQLSARAYLKTLENVLIDSVNLAHQLLNPDNEQWVANFSLPMVEEFYKISITSFDVTASKHFTVPNATRFTTAGPVVLDSIFCTKSGTNYLVNVFLRNESTTTTITNPSVKLICNDAWVLPITNNVKNLPNIPPGGTVSNSTAFTISYIDSLFLLNNCFNFKVEVMSGGWTYWKDSLQVIIPLEGVEDELNPLPTEFALEQNYPNPFNPTTSIQYAISSRQFVTLKVYDVIGKEVATLVNEEKAAGKHKVNFNASTLSSGVYFYRLQAGSFVQTRKMLLLK